MEDKEETPKMRSVSITNMNTCVTIKSEYKEDKIDDLITKAEKIADKYGA